jgi:hypothetical protein
MLEGGNTRMTTPRMMMMMMMMMMTRTMTVIMMMINRELSVRHDFVAAPGRTLQALLEAWLDL